MLHAVADLGWFPQFHGTPLSWKLIRSVGPVDYIYNTSWAAKVLTVAHLQVLWSEFWSPRAQQTTQKKPFSIVSGCGQCKSGRDQKIVCALRAFFMLRTPLYKILNPPLACQYILQMLHAELKLDTSIQNCNSCSACKQMDGLLTITAPSSVGLGVASTPTTSQCVC